MAAVTVETCCMDEQCKTLLIGIAEACKELSEKMSDLSDSIRFDNQVVIDLHDHKRMCGAVLRGYINERVSENVLGLREALMKHDLYFSENRAAILMADHERMMKLQQDCLSATD